MGSMFVFGFWKPMSACLWLAFCMCVCDEFFWFIFYVETPSQAYMTLGRADKSVTTCNLRYQINKMSIPCFADGKKNSDHKPVDANACL